jgi:hypothetical protein
MSQMSGTNGKIFYFSFQRFANRRMCYGCLRRIEFVRNLSLRESLTSTQKNQFHLFIFSQCHITEKKKIKYFPIGSRHLTHTVEIAGLTERKFKSLSQQCVVVAARGTGSLTD